MKYLQRFILILLSYFSIFMFFNTELVYSSFSGYENQISEGSSGVKVKKLQEVFSGLGLYDGVIDGKYESIKESLLSYQKTAGIIVENNDYGAGYFGNKTIDTLEKEFGDEFIELKETYLKINEPSKEERYFIVTAYYSPLPGQDRYSYKPSEKRYRTYEEEIRLQGKGTNGASGKGVFSGMIAAPRDYAFGTKIYLEGVGVGSVEDRGGAIVNSGERSKCTYDCIDVWMGYGDEGRIRAEQWGIRKIKGKVLDSNTQVTIEFDESPVEKYAKLQVNAVEPESNSVIDLQSLLTEIGLYTGEINGDFETVKYILIKYQIEKGIISSEVDSQAGYFGPKTLVAFRKDYGTSGNGLFIDKPIFGLNAKVETVPLSKLNNLEELKNNLDKFLNKRYKGDLTKVNRFKTKLSNSLEELINSNISTKQKLELTYFKSIL